MKQLVVDTSSSALSISVLDGHKLCGSLCVDGTKQHGEIIVTSVQMLLEQVGWTIHDIQTVCVGIGPGSYTGLRMGVTFAKTWASTQPIQLTTCSSLALIAAQVKKENALIVPIMDARRLSAYTAVYEWDDDQLVSVIEDLHSEWEPFVKKLQEINVNQRPVVLIGRNVEAFMPYVTETISNVLVQWINTPNIAPNTEDVLNVPVIVIEDPALCVPNYAHVTLAEKEWQDKQVEAIHNETTLVESTVE